MRNSTAVLELLKRWLNPSVPMESAGFTVIQVVGLVLEGALRQWIWTGDATTRFLLLVGAMAMFAVMAISTAKRLLDVWRSRWWTVLITGLIVLDILSAIHAKASPTLRFAAIVCLVLSVGYLALVAVLIFEKPTGRRGPRVTAKKPVELKSARSVSASGPELDLRPGIGL